MIFLYVTVVPTVKFVLAILALFFDVFAFSTKYYAFLTIPLLKRKGGTVVLNDKEAFTMAPSGNAIVMRRGEEVFASAFVKIPVYRSATEMNKEEKTDFARLFSRVLSLTNGTVKFATQLYVINKDEYISGIKQKLDESEEKYQAASVNETIPKAASERIKGEVTMWHNLFDSVSKVNSHSLEAYAMVTAEGANEEEAVNLALQRAEEIGAGTSAIMGVSTSIAEGNDLLKFIEPDYMIPVVTVSEELRKEAMTGGM